jgi:tRNA dimethylallyltransferase
MQTRVHRRKMTPEYFDLSGFSFNTTHCESGFTHTPEEVMSCKKVIVVTGQTATGKTGLGIELAHHFNTEVISADSQLIYYGLDIGTAKPTLAEQQGIPHHLINVVSPENIYSVASYKSDARQHLNTLWDTGKIPVIVGGTGFYLKALLQASVLPDVPVNEPFRQLLRQTASEQGFSVLHHQLGRLDPLRASALHPNDGVRIIRALEIVEATGQPVPTAVQAPDVSVCWIGLRYQNRDTLWETLEHRIRLMLEKGWLAEVEHLIACYGFEAHALNVAHGYPELMAVLQGKQTLEDAIVQITLNVRQYAKRQLTWFRSNPGIHWFDVDKQDTQTLGNQILEMLNPSCS